MNFTEQVIEKYGKEVKLSTLLELMNNVQVVYPTGSLALDKATGVDGIPGGRVTELAGAEHSGKTSVAISTIARLHENTNEKALYVDAESALDEKYAIKCGVDPSRFIVLRPEYGEMAFTTAELGVRSGEFAIVVVDSVPAISPRAEMEGEVGDAHIGLVPRLVSQFLRMTAFSVRESGVAVIFTNQLRDRIARVQLPPETPGGRALKHFSSLRIFLRNAGPIEAGKNIVGSKIEFTVKKNKVGAPYGTGAFEIWNDRGVCVQGGLLDLAVELNVIRQKGAWFIYNEKAVAQGRVAAINALTEKELYLQVLEDIKNAKASVGDQNISAGSIQEYPVD